MMISSTQIQQLMRAYGVQGKQKAASVEAGKKVEKKRDETVISQEAKILQGAAKALREIPEVRQEKVEALRQAVRSGAYNPSGEEVAEKMLGRALVDKLF